MPNRTRTLLLAGPDARRLATLRPLFETMTHLALTLGEATSVEAVREAFQTGAYDACLLDAALDGAQGRTLLPDARAGHTALVLLLDTAPLQEVTALLGLGAADALAWEGLDAPTLEAALCRALARRSADAARLRTSNAFPDLIEHAHDIITVLAPDATMHYNSPAARRVMGYEPDDLVGQNAFAYIHEDDHDLAFQTMAEVLAAPGLSRQIAYRFRHHDGSWRVLESVGSAIVDEDGALRVVVNSRDVTERKAAEQALKQSEALNRGLLDAFPDAMVRMSRDGTYIGYKAPPGFEWLVEPDHFMGQTPEAVLPPELARLTTQAHAQALATGAVQTVEYTIELGGTTRFREARFVAYGEGEVISVLRDFTLSKRADERLRGSEEKFRELFENSPDAIFVEAVDGVVLDVNPAACRLHRQSAQEIIGRNVRDLVPPDQREEVMHFFQKLVQGEIDYALGYSWTADGRAVPVELRARRITYDQRPALLLHVRDITERRKAEEALRRSETQNRAIVDALPDALVRLSRAGTYLEIRVPRDYKAFTDPQQLLGRSAYEVLPAEVARRARACVERALKTGQMQTFEYEIEAGGDRRIREGRVVPCGDDEVISIQRDITERKRAEDEVKRLKAFYQQVLDDLPADVAVMEPDGRILYLNAASVRDAEMRQWLIGKTGFDYCRRRNLDPELARTRQRHLQRAAAEKCAVTFEETMQNRAGDERHIFRIASPVLDAHGRVVQVIGYGLDITEMKRAERDLKHSREQLRELARHLQSVREAERKRISREVHDQLGQALTALHMDVAWIGKRLADEQDTLRERVETAKARIADTVGTVRRIATELRPGILDDLGLAAALEWQTQEFATRTGLSCAFTDKSIPADLDADLDADLSTAVFRVFQELLTNVARHADASRVEVALHTYNGALVLAVKDDGRGIEDLELVHSRSLGMLGMRERTQAWGGQIRFASRPGEGTEAIVEIPLPTPAEA